MSATIHGFAAMKKKLDRLSKQGARRALRKATRAGTNVLLAAVKTTVPRDEGLLAKMEASKVTTKGGIAGGIVGADRAKLNAAEEAHGDAHRPSTLDHLVEFGHVAPDGRMIPPRGYMRRAADASMPTAEKTFIDRLAAEIESEAERG